MNEHNRESCENRIVGVQTNRQMASVCCKSGNDGIYSHSSAAVKLNLRGFW